MRDRRPLANAIYLHRCLSLPCFPEAEAGPAAIYSRRAGSLQVIGWRVKAISCGEHDSPIGAREGVRRRVTVLSPLVPGISDVTRDLDWRLWDGGQFPHLAADVIVIVRPLAILRRMRLQEAAEYLVNVAFGGGAVYAATDLLTMLRQHERCSQRRRKAA